MGYYRIFIKSYASICRPLYLALKKDNFQWGPLQEQAFQQLKLIISTPPLLSLPNFVKPFILETDASGTRIGAVLMQDGKALPFTVNAWVQKRQLGPSMKKKL
jgi:hypothetical protein